ncbi:hypothetical protein [Brytella acorum]|uniref:Uncharacterized protein n=1 Tax=Brytella acorum TaxID=2959299 RepID=A0AA35Y171_9PROT|nr:hypothetical protein [Brytella acorum]CAI9120324.1 hypothetical protein LMG32879_001156 [Brytella acorum]
MVVSSLKLAKSASHATSVSCDNDAQGRKMFPHGTRETYVDVLRDCGWNAQSHRGKQALQAAMENHPEANDGFIRSTLLTNTQSVISLPHEHGGALITDNNIFIKRRKFSALNGNEVR